MRKVFTLTELVGSNSNELLSNKEAVFCGRCNLKTSQTTKHTYNPDIFMIEIVRATEGKNVWIKNNSWISFDDTKLSLPGFDRSYNIVASCHHRGSLKGGHWTTKIRTNNGWWEMDDLKSYCVKTVQPGIKDSSVSLLLLIADNMLA